MIAVDDETVLTKLHRLQHEPGYRPTVVDLFSGCGGASLGFQREGCEILAGLEIEAVRAQTHAFNFHRHHQTLHGAPHDVTKLDPVGCLEILAGRPSPEVDIVVGGPPCQAYARVGRAKLRQIAQHPEAFRLDERGQLYAAYITFVAALKPVAVLMENVPDILNYGGLNVAQAIAENLEELGYECRYTLLNAANFGVPQTRERWFLIGFHRTLNAVPEFPEPTHYVELPVGYKGTRSYATALFRGENGQRPRHAIPLPSARTELPPAVTCRDALSDLPVISEREKLALRRGQRDLREKRQYESAPTTEFQHQMRRWKGFESSGQVSAHVIRSLVRDYPIFRAMLPGDDYPRAHALAKKLFQLEVDYRMGKGEPLTPESDGWQQLYRQMVPPYDPGKFPNKWRKLEADFPSRTLMAHLSHDTYSHIHYDNTQARTISVREAARLQSFPDGFEFCGAMNAAFGQIGNAIPPLLVSALAHQMLRQLKASLSQNQPVMNDMIQDDDQPDK